MSGNKIYRTARQEAIRKAMIAKLWCLGKNVGLEKEEIYAAIAADHKRKGIVLYHYNWVGSGKEKRVSLGSLKIWQLKQVIEALFPEREEGKRTEGTEGTKGEEGDGGKGMEEGGAEGERTEGEGEGARIVEYEDWSKGASNGSD